MKRSLLFILIMSLCSLAGYGITGVKRFYPKKSIVGMTKNGNTYKLQSIEKDPKTILIGYDSKTNTYGRVCLVFDFSSLPKDAFIKEVKLRLVSKNNSDNNYNGDLNFYVDLDYRLSFAGAKEWADLGIRGVKAGYTSLKYEGYSLFGWASSLSYFIIDYAKEYENPSNFSLHISKKDEQTVCRLSGEPDDLFIEMHYTTNTADKGNLGYKITPTSDCIACNNETVSYTLSGIEKTPDATVQWSAGKNMTLISSQGANATFKASGNGYGTVNAAISYFKHTETISNSEVWVGAPQHNPIGFGEILGDNTCYVNESVTATVNFHGLDSSSRFKWTTRGDCYLSYTYANTATFIPNRTGLLILSVETNNRCGQSAYGGSLSFNVLSKRGDDWGGGPTPLSSPVISTKVYSTTGAVVHSERSESEFDINSTNLQSGVYIIETIDAEGNVNREKVMLKK